MAPADEATSLSVPFLVPISFPAERIGTDLETLIPALQKSIGRYDFRPDGHAEEIVGGVCYDAQHAAENPTGPFRFKVVFGGEPKCLAAHRALAAIGIHAEMGRTGSREDALWSLSFILPADWQPAYVVEAAEENLSRQRLIDAVVLWYESGFNDPQSNAGLRTEVEIFKLAKAAK